MNSFSSMGRSGSLPSVVGSFSPRGKTLRAGAPTGGAFTMSEKRVCAAPRIYMHFFGHFHPPNPPKGRAKARSPLLNRTFRTDSMRPRRIYSAKGAFTLSIDRAISCFPPGQSSPKARFSLALIRPMSYIGANNTRQAYVPQGKAQIGGLLFWSACLQKNSKKRR